MEALICKQCGGQIDPHTYVCKYCGTAYERTPDNIIIQTSQPRTVTLGCEIVIDDIMKHYEGEALSHFVINQMTTELARALTPLLRIQTETDPYTMHVICKGRIRVLEPDFDFR